MPQVGSFLSAAVNPSMARLNWKECSRATARSNSFCAAWLQDVAKCTAPSFSPSSCGCSCAMPFGTSTMAINLVITLVLIIPLPGPEMIGESMMRRKLLRRQAKQSRITVGMDVGFSPGRLRQDFASEGHRYVSNLADHEALT